MVFSINIYSMWAVNRSLTIREECRIRLFETIILKIFRPKRNENWTRLIMRNFIVPAVHPIYSRVIKFRR